MAARRAALISLILLTLVWSFNWTVMKVAMRYAGPFDFSALRYSLGTAVVFAALAWRGGSLRPPPLLPVVLIGLAQTMGFQALAQWALVEGGAGKTALFVYTMPFWAILMGWLVLSEHIGRRHLAGIAAAAVGVLLIISPWRGMADPAPVLLAVGGGICWAIGTVVAKHEFKRGEVSLLMLTAWQMLVGTVGLVLLALLVPEAPVVWEPLLIATILYNGVLSSGLAWVLWAVIVKNLPTHVAGISSLAIPVLGVGFAWLLLGEQPGLAESAGMALIVTALVVVNR